MKMNWLKSTRGIMLVTFGSSAPRQLGTGDCFCVSAGEQLLGKRFLSTLLTVLTRGVLCL